MKGIKVILSVIAAIFLLIGIPIIINECYKANCGYITVWDGADVLGYYRGFIKYFVHIAQANQNLCRLFSNFGRTVSIYVILL